MNKLVTTEPLEISKETIASLTPEQLQAIEGGAAAGLQTSCWATTCSTQQQDEATEAAS
jgi:hypothetical protein